MNFFGHAAIAADHMIRENPHPEAGELGRLCLGAMLPDFVGMLRLGKPHLTDEALARGVSFHHRTDHAFHDLPSFQQLSRQTFAWLAQRGLARGPARAVAHVGIEILLDEVMANDAAAREAYLLALGVPLATALRFDAPSDLERLETLRRNLSERAATQLWPAAEVVARRIRRTLDGRPRLATDDAGERLLSEWVTVARPWVAAEAPQLLASLRAVLADQARAE